MSSRQKLASTVNAGGATADAGAPARPQRFTATDSPAAMAKGLNQLSTTLAEAQRGATSRNSATVVFEDRPCTVGGLLRLTHGLNRRARWRVVDWVPTVDGVACNIVRNASDSALQDTNTIALRSYAAGVASIEVF